VSATCSFCGFPDGPDHDVDRCKLVAREVALAASGEGDKLSRRITQLVRWLAKNPDAPGRADRLEFLDHFVALARKGVRL
jgi:hypothetical protein